MNERLQKQMGFLIEADRLKGVVRKTSLIDGSRRENSAEHSWHVVLTAMALAEHANEPIDVLKTVKMLAVHDLGEIEAGDVFHFHKTEAGAEVERAAAKKFFSQLPAEQAEEYFNLWLEFEARESPEARFAAGLDRLWPCIQNFYNEGGTWKEFQISLQRAIEKTEYMAKGSEALWQYVRMVLMDGKEKGYFPTESP